jgi:hypothetical protein
MGMVIFVPGLGSLERVKRVYSFKSCVVACDESDGRCQQLHFSGLYSLRLSASVLEAPSSRTSLTLLLRFIHE